MTPLATVLVPTHDHGPTLRLAVESALAQTVAELEVVVLGDGVPDEVRPLVDAVAELDPRVTVRHHPKSPRTGEPWRARALEEACGELVLYLSDDDLWLPEHVETMAGLLAEADFAHALPVLVEADGTPFAIAVDLALDGYAARMLGGQNFVPFSCGAHTLAAYRRLPVGWETTPDGIWTDLFMWQKFLRLPGVRLASATRPTVVHLPSSVRRGRSAEQRAAELAAWAARVRDGTERAALVREIGDGIVRRRAEAELVLAATLEHVESLTARLEAAEAERDRLRVERDRVLAERDAAAGEREALRAHAEAVAATLTWRLRERLLGSRLGRTAARARAARAARRGTARSGRAP